AVRRPLPDAMLPSPVDVPQVFAEEVAISIQPEFVRVHVAHGDRLRALWINSPDVFCVAEEHGAPTVDDDANRGMGDPCGRHQGQSQEDETDSSVHGWAQVYTRATGLDDSDRSARRRSRTRSRLWV